MAARPARRKSSSRGSARRRQAPRAAAHASQPARVTARRLERAVALLHLPYSVTPDKEIRVMVDAGVLSLVLDGAVLRVGTWWLERAPLSLEVPLLVVANGWNLDRGVPVAGVADVENGGALLVSGSQAVPVGAGLSDDQLLHVVEDAVDDCVGLLGHLEEIFPQTRFDAIAEAVGLRGEDGGVVEPTTEESAQQARELVERAKEMAALDPDGAGALLVGAMEHAKRADLGPQDVGADEALAMLLERSLEDRGLAGTPQAAAVERLLEGVRSGSLVDRARAGGEGRDVEAGEPSVSPGQQAAGAGAQTLSDEEAAAPREGGQEAVTLTRARQLLAAAGRKVLEPEEETGSGALEQAAARASAGAVPQEELVVRVGDRSVQVTVEGDDLVVRSRWEAAEEGQPSDALVEAALVASAGWNRSGRILGARALIPEGDLAAEGEEPGAGGDSTTTGAAEERSGQHRLAVEGYALWCVALGATDAQLSQMLEAALVEVEYLARYCDDYVVEQLASPELLGSVGQAGDASVEAGEEAAAEAMPEASEEAAAEGGEQGLDLEGAGEGGEQLASPELVGSVGQVGDASVEAGEGGEQGLDPGAASEAEGASGPAEADGAGAPEDAAAAEAPAGAGDTAQAEAADGAEGADAGDTGTKDPGDEGADGGDGAEPVEPVELAGSEEPEVSESTGEVEALGEPAEVDRTDSLDQ